MTIDVSKADNKDVIAIFNQSLQLLNEGRKEL